MKDVVELEAIAEEAMIEVLEKESPIHSYLFFLSLDREEGRVDESVTKMLKM